MVHSTLVTAALFLLADLIGRQRGERVDKIKAAIPIRQPGLLGFCFLIASVAVIGMPPLSGFIGKVWLLNATLKTEYAAIFWAIYLLVSLVVLFAVAKAGSTIFWRHEVKESVSVEQKPVHIAQVVAVIILVACAPLMSVFAGPLSEYAIGAATQLHDVNNHIKVILTGGL